jgi:hypothetical protein
MGNILLRNHLTVSKTRKKPNNRVRQTKSRFKYICWLTYRLVTDRLIFPKREAMDLSIHGQIMGNRLGFSHRFVSHRFVFRLAQSICNDAHF